MNDLERSMEIETEERNEVIIPPERRYYKVPINLEEAERYITSGLVTAARAYVANGYYLRRIRDDRLFEEDGYTNFESYVRDRYGKDKGWASKCIKVNQQLSVDGDSPLLDSRYQEYSTYQLVELAYMTEEQREQATPEQTVKELHEIRVPEKAEDPEPEEVVTSQLPDHLMDYGTRRAYCDAFARMLLTRFWDWFEEDYQNRVSLVDKSEVELKSRFKETWHFQDPVLEQRVAHINLFDEYIQIWDGNGQLLGNAEWFYLCASVHAMWNEVSLERAKQTAAEVQQTKASCCETAAEEEDDDNVPGQMEIEDFPEYLPEGYQVEETVLPEEMQEPEQTFRMETESIFPRIPDESWNLGDLPQAKERYLRELAEKFVEQLQNRDFLVTVRPDKRMMIQRLQNWNGGKTLLSDGVTASATAEIVEFFRCDEDLGCASYQRLITQIGKALDAYIAKLPEKDAEPEVIEEPEPEDDLLCDDCKNASSLTGNPDLCSNCGPQGKSYEPIEDAKPEPPLEYDRKVLLEMIQNAIDTMKEMADYWRENKPRTYTKHRMELAAYLSFLEKHDRQEEEPEPDRQEQEPLPVLRNNDQRKEWLNGYQSWPVWFEVPEASEVYYRYDLPDGSSLVMCEYHQWYFWMEQFDYDGDPDVIRTREYLLPADGYHYLSDCSSNRSAMIEKLKEVQKNGK